MPAPKDPLKYEEWRRKISLSQMGDKNHNFGKPKSKETKEKLSLSKSGENNPMFGKHLTEEHKKKISESSKGRIVTAETLKKISGKNNHNFGKPKSEETKKKLSLSKSGEKNHNFGKHFTEEHKRKLSLAKSGVNHPNFGKHPSEETLKKMSLSRMGEKNHNFGKPMSEEQKKKISKSKIGKILSEETRIKLSMTNLGITDIKDWNGYAIEQLYCSLFTREFKNRQYEVTNRTCLLCGESVERPHCHHVYWQKSSCCQNADEKGELYFNIRGKKVIPNILYNEELEYGLNKFAVLCNSCHGKVKGNKDKSYIDYIREIEDIINTKYKGRSYYTKEEYWGNGYYTKENGVEKYYDAITGYLYGKYLCGFVGWGLLKHSKIKSKLL